MENSGFIAWKSSQAFLLIFELQWETDFYTPPVLGGAALFDNSAAAVYKNSGSLGHRIFIHHWC